MTSTQAWKPADTAAADFATVLAQELDVISRQRAGGAKADPQASGYARAIQMKLAGLAFSGGGIRSATFNLGFLQGLANRRALHGFDYLSTVSGGGYIGAWLSALLRRRNGGKPVGEAEVIELAQSELSTPPASGPRASAAALRAPEQAAVRFVRRYADYLTPRLGLSGDTLALISVALRNVVVIQLLLLAMLVTVFSLLLWLASEAWISPDSAFAGLRETLRAPLETLGLEYAAPGHWLMLPALLLLAVSLGMAVYALSFRRETAGDAGQAAKTRGAQIQRPIKRSPNAVIAACVLFPGLVSGELAAIALQTAAEGDKPIQAGMWIALPVVFYLGVWWTSLSNWRAWPGVLGGAATLGLALWTGVEPLGQMLKGAPYGHAVAFAPLVALNLYSFVITVHLALAGTSISEEQREWWARIGGQTIFLTLAWTLAFGFLLYVPPLLSHSLEAASTGGALWAALSWVGARLAQGKDTGAKGGTPWKELLAKLAPWVFVIGMLGLAAWVYVSLLARLDYAAASTLAERFQTYWRALSALKSGLLLQVAGATGVLSAMFLWGIDLNIFSAHSFYRNRLMRSFLGASNAARTPNPFTGFDEEDDLRLDELAGQRPIPLINANVNLTGGDELAWQTRRGASFVFSPAYCGFSAQPTNDRLIGGYRDTKTYGGGFSLATATAVSGAAASPNMGFHTAPSVAALLTIFNMRLARWCPNPEKPEWNKPAPNWGAGHLFAELLGEANGKSAWINLSDGGHFDNLGLYELVRRRAALILVTDVGADERYQFDDLAMVTRRLWTDFGAKLEIKEAALAAIRPKVAGAASPDDPRFSDLHWAFGCIRYPDGQRGCLIYVKSSLTRHLPLDVRQYKDTHSAFPHESTADQWFDEDQFEAYRHLGQFIAEQLLDILLLQHGGEAGSVSAREFVDTLIERVETRLAPPDKPQVSGGQA